MDGDTSPDASSRQQLCIWFTFHHGCEKGRKCIEDMMSLASYLRIELQKTDQVFSSVQAIDVENWEHPPWYRDTDLYSSGAAIPAMKMEWRWIPSIATAKPMRLMCINRIVRLSSLGFLESSASIYSSAMKGRWLAPRVRNKVFTPFPETGSWNKIFVNMPASCPKLHKEISRGEGVLFLIRFKIRVTPTGYRQSIPPYTKIPYHYFNNEHENFSR